MQRRFQAVSLFAIAGLAGAMTLQDPSGSPPTEETVEAPSDPYVVPADALLVIAYHGNGIRKREALYSDGRPEGLWIGWGEDGGLSFQGHYRKGLKHGVWQTYDRSSGALLSEEAYENGILHGPWTTFESGSITGTGAYDSGRRTGIWTTFGPGYIEGTGSYEDDLRVGNWTSWHGRDIKSAEGAYEEDLRVGAWTIWHEGGIKSAEGTYEGGVKVGDWTYWNEDGEIDEERTGFYRDGERTRSRRRRIP